jgi:hypothetical protein
MCIEDEKQCRTRSLEKVLGETGLLDSNIMGLRDRIKWISSMTLSEGIEIIYPKRGENYEEPHFIDNSIHPKASFYQ